MNASTLSHIFLLKRSIDLSLLRQGFHIPPEFHALVYAALWRELHHGESCDIQLMVEGKARMPQGQVSDIMMSAG